MSGCSAISASRSSNGMRTMSEFGSAALLIAMPANNWPRTRRAGDPYAVLSSTPGKVSAIFRTASNPIAFFGMCGYFINLLRVALEARDVLLVFQTRVFQQVGVERDVLVQHDCPGPRVRLGIVDRHFHLETSKRRPAEPLDDLRAIR